MTTISSGWQQVEDIQQRRHMNIFWKTWAPPKCRFFLWAAHNKCWTADRLAHHGTTHPDKCPLCDQEEETIDHLLISCAVLVLFPGEGQLIGGLTTTRGCFLL
jgi:hypothetical protein